MRLLLVDKRFPDEPEIERAVIGGAGDYEFYPVADDVPEDAWSKAEGIQTFRESKAVNAMAMAGKLKNCRIIVRGGVGFDNLDLQALGEMGIAVCNVPDYGTTEVADHAMALFLALRRGITTYNDALRKDPAAGWKYDAAPCVDRLRGRHFGIIGLGRIGTAAARRAQAFDMDILFYDPEVPGEQNCHQGLASAATMTDTRCSRRKGQVRHKRWG